jgi:hypothetical protein
MSGPYQLLLVPLRCERCGKKYYTSGYWGDYAFCPSCAERMKAELDEKFSLDLGEEEEDAGKGGSRGAGRREKKYREEYCELLIEGCSNGETEAEFCRKVKIDRSTLTRWAERHARFRKAREVARLEYEAWFERYYRLAMLGKIEVNTPLVQLYAKCKFGWTEKTELELSAGANMMKLVSYDAAFPSETLPAPDGGDDGVSWEFADGEEGE